MLLYFLVEDSPQENMALTLHGRSWKLQRFELPEKDEGQRVSFSCISYTWGTERVPSPFHPDYLISNRTVPAVDTFIRHRPRCERIWIDAFCIPHDPDERTLTLESMGWIYSKANEVIAVLSEATLPALKVMSNGDRVEIEHLHILENEAWVSRAWTYQETVNSRELYITCEGAHDTIIEGGQFLNCIGHTLSKMPEPALEKRRRYPRLDNFETVIADYFMAPYEDRSALQVMSNMDRRCQIRAEDHFYAMIGAISTARASSAGEVEPCEAFMSVCEKKGDFSFIFSAAKRRRDSGWRWRPVVGDLPSILPWHCYGSYQPGRIESDGLRLDNMVSLHHTKPSIPTQEFVQDWLVTLKYTEPQPKPPLSESVYSVLQLMGFRGSSTCITAESGLFFPFEPVPPSSVQQLIISGAVKWVFGSPGFAEYDCEDGEGLFYAPGVFIGRIDKSTEISVKIG